MESGVSEADVLEKEALDKRKILLKTVAIVVFWGALWGLIEATLGYCLHFLRIKGGSSFILFPMACYYMEQVRRQTDSHMAIIYMGVFAACIKLLDFFIPGHDPIRIIYPAIAMVLESLAVFGAFKAAKKLDRKLGYPEALFASISWRVIFLAFQIVSLAPKDYPAPRKMAKFLLLDSLINSLLIYLYIRVAKPQEQKNKVLIKHISLGASAIVFVIAILSKWVI